jgi:D-alanyl-D-alanine dipeptidase
MAHYKNGCERSALEKDSHPAALNSRASTAEVAKAVFPGNLQAMNRIPALTAAGALACCVLLHGKPASAPPMADVAKEVPGVTLDLRYATADNFFKQKFYTDTRALLRPATAKKLAAAEAEFEKQGLHLKVWDAWRPLKVQREMWRVLPDSRYVANPANGSRHNRGAAVDVTLTKNGKELEMPTGFDDFTARAHADAGGVSATAKANRSLLREVMEHNGFTALSTEWWHFDDTDWKQYEIIE